MGDVGNIRKEITIPNRIFVKGFPHTTTEDELTNAFRKYGTIIETNIIWKPRTAQRYAFITYDSQHVAEDVITNYRTIYLHGAELTVAPAKIRRDRTPFKGRFHTNVNEATLTPPQSPLSHQGAKMVPVPYTVSPDGLFVFHQPMGGPPLCMPLNPAAPQPQSDGSVDEENSSLRSESPMPSTPERSNTPCKITPNRQERIPTLYEANRNSPSTPTSPPGTYYKAPPQQTNLFDKVFPLPSFGRGQPRPTFNPLANQQHSRTQVTTTGVHMPNIRHSIAYGNHPLNTVLNGNMAYQYFPVATLMPPPLPVHHPSEWPPSPQSPQAAHTTQMNYMSDNHSEGKKVTFSVPSASGTAVTISHQSHVVSSTPGGSFRSHNGGYRVNGVPQSINCSNLKHQQYVFMSTGPGKVKRVIVQQ